MLAWLRASMGVDQRRFRSLARSAGRTRGTSGATDLEISGIAGISTSRSGAATTVFTFLCCETAANFSLFHPTLLEGVHAGGRRFVVKKKKEKRERKKRKQNQRRKRKKKHQERGNITEIKERIKIIREKSVDSVVALFVHFSV